MFGGGGRGVDIGGGLQGGRGAHLKLTDQSENTSHYFSSDCRSDLTCTVYISVQYFRGKLIKRKLSNTSISCTEVRSILCE